MILKCENCGAALEGAHPGMTVRCEYCGTELHVPAAQVHVEPFRPQVVAGPGYTPGGSAKFAALGVVFAVVAIMAAGIVFGIHQSSSRAEVARQRALEQQRQAEQQIAQAMSAAQAIPAVTAEPAVPPPEVDPGQKVQAPITSPRATQQAATAKPVVPDVDAIAYDVLFATTIRSCVPKLGKIRSPGTHPRLDVVTKMRFDRGWAKDVTATVTMVDDPNQFAPRDESLTLGAPLGASGKAKVEADAASCTKKAIEAHHFRSTKLQNAAGDVRMTLKFENDVTFQSGSSP